MSKIPAKYQPERGFRLEAFTGDDEPEPPPDPAPPLPAAPLLPPLPAPPPPSSPNLVFFINLPLSVSRAIRSVISDTYS